MSRVGKMPLNLPSGVAVSFEADYINVKGPKGILQQFNLPGVEVSAGHDQLNVKRTSDEAKARANHGLMRALLANMITGVTEGYQKKLTVSGVGYRVQLVGGDLKLSLGFSHDVVYKIPAGVSASVEQNIITISGINKQQVNQVAAEIRALKKPEPYKGKGIMYEQEKIIRKSGKSGKETASA